VRVFTTLGLILWAEKCAASNPRHSQFPISVINLDKDSERLSSVSAELERAGVPLQQVMGKNTSRIRNDLKVATNVHALAV
jgi:hypothetical protein